MFEILEAAGAFTLGAITDWLWCKWMQNVQNKRPLPAAIFSLLIGIIGFVYTLMIVEKVWLSIISYMIGCFIGTYRAVKNDRSGHNTESDRLEGDRQD